MGFYTSPSFFAVLAVCILPAAALGLSGRSIRGWGMASTALFLALLFADDAGQLAAFLAFLAVAGAACAAVSRSWAQGRKSMPVYYSSLAATLAPLVC